MVEPSNNTPRILAIAGQIRSKVDEAITTIKEKASSTPIDPNDEDVLHLDYAEDGDDFHARGRHGTNHFTSNYQYDPNNTTIGTSSCSPESAHPNDSNRTAEIIDSVITTLFGVCTGTSPGGAGGGLGCPNMHVSDNDKNQIMESMQKRNSSTKLGKKTSRALNSLRYSCSGANKKGLAHDKDEAFYAQFYQDDHGQAAREFLAARERERQEGQMHRQHLQSLQKSARVEAQLRSTTNHHARLNSTNTLMAGNGKDGVNNMNTAQQHKERIRVGKNGYRLCGVNANGGLNPNASGTSYDDGDSAAGMSYNYDDGISALSAHTLEEMAKAEMILQRRRGIPQEQGFDIAVNSSSEDADEEEDVNAGTNDKSNGGNANVHKDKNSKHEHDFDKGPPSPASTYDSSNASKDEELTTYRIEDVVNEERRHKEQQLQQQQTTSELNSTLEHYPVQMARPTIGRESGGPEPVSVSSSNASADWRVQEQKYWMQVVENDKSGNGNPLSSSSVGEN